MASSIVFLLFVLSSVSCQINLDHKSVGYKASNETLTWVNAMKFCQYDGGKLVEIYDIHEQRAVEMFLEAINPQGDKYYWTGLNDLAEEGRWIWEPSGIPASFFYWQQGEPNNKGKMEHFAHIRSTGFNRTWNDCSNEPTPYCGFKNYALCQYKL